MSICDTGQGTVFFQETGLSFLFNSIWWVQSGRIGLTIIAMAIFGHHSVAYYQTLRPKFPVSLQLFQVLIATSASIACANFRAEVLCLYNAVTLKDDKWVFEIWLSFRKVFFQQRLSMSFCALYVLVWLESIAMFVFRQQVMFPLHILDKLFKYDLTAQVRFAEQGGSAQAGAIREATTKCLTAFVTKDEVEVLRQGS